MCGKPPNQPYQQNEAACQVFRKAILRKLSDPELTVWFGDETGISADHRPRKRWVHKGKRITILTNGSHRQENRIGAVQPQSGRLIALQVPEVDSDVFLVFLDELANEIKGENTLLVLDIA
ncbi:MAG: transposase [bacterium]|nr:transposase [bacterium]